jgi:hypothetical protein
VTGPTRKEWEDACDGAFGMWHDREDLPLDLMRAGPEPDDCPDWVKRVRLEELASPLAARPLPLEFGPEFLHVRIPVTKHEPQIPQFAPETPADAPPYRVATYLIEAEIPLQELEELRPRSDRTMTEALCRVLNRQPFGHCSRQGAVALHRELRAGALSAAATRDLLHVVQELETQIGQARTRAKRPW